MAVSWSNNANVHPSPLISGSFVSPSRIFYFVYGSRSGRRRSRYILVICGIQRVHPGVKNLDRLEPTIRLQPPVAVVLNTLVHTGMR